MTRMHHLVVKLFEVRINVIDSLRGLVFAFSKLTFKFQRNYSMVSRARPLLAGSKYMTSRDPIFLLYPHTKGVMFYRVGFVHHH